MVDPTKLYLIQPPWLSIEQLSRIKPVNHSTVALQKDGSQLCGPLSNEMSRVHLEFRNRSLQQTWNSASTPKSHRHFLNSIIFWGWTSIVGCLRHQHNNTKGMKCAKIICGTPCCTRVDRLWGCREKTNNLCERSTRLQMLERPSSKKWKSLLFLCSSHFQNEQKK